MKKYAILTASILVNLCLGGVYAWSIFVPELVANYGYTTAQTQIVFGTIICLLTVTMLFSGRLENRIGPRLMVIACSGLVLAGYFAGSLSGPRFPVLWLGYGVISGIAIGFGYVSVLAVSLRWFEARKGLACGLVLSGYGCGAILLSTLVQALYRQNWDVMTIFRFIGFAYGLLILLCALVLTNPAHYAVKQITPTLRYRHILLRWRFFVLALTVGLGTFPGLLLIGNLKPIALFLGYSPLVAVLAIWLVSVGNTIGRIVGGFAHDRFKAATIEVILIAVTLSTLVMMWEGHGAVSFLIVVVITGTSYGALISNIPAQVSAEYGHENFARIYPFVFLVHGFVALFASPSAGWIYDRYQTYIPALLIAAAIAALCFTAFFLEYRNLIRRRARRRQGA